MSNGGSGSLPLPRLLDGIAKRGAQKPCYSSRRSAPRLAKPLRDSLSTSLPISFLSWQKIPEDGLDRLSLLPLQKFSEQGFAPCWIKRHVRSRFVLISNDCRGWSVDGVM